MLGAYRLVAQIDIKKRRIHQEFSPSSHFKIISFLVQLLRVAPEQRSFTLGALSDTVWIQFWKVWYTNDELHIQHSPVLALHGPGSEWLYSLMNVDNITQLGFREVMLTQISDKPLNINESLGEGTSSVVWAAVYESMPVVVKIFKAGNSEHFRRELANLKLIGGRPACECEVLMS